MSNIETAGNRNPIVGLTTDQVDLSFFDFADKDYVKRLSSSFDFYMEAAEARRKKLGDKKNKKHSFHSWNVKKSPELTDFLKTVRPPTLFFKPQDIASLLTPDSDIIVNHEKTEKLETWQFTLNPKKYEVSNDRTSPYRKQTMTLTRGVMKYGTPEPYLVMSFPATYDGSNIIFPPKIKITYGDSIPRNEIDKAMIKLLDMKETSVSKQLEFTVKKERNYWEERRSDKTITHKEWDTYPVEISLKKDVSEKRKKNKFIKIIDKLPLLKTI